MKLRFNVNPNNNRNNGNRNLKSALTGSLLGFIFMLYWTYSAVRGGAPWIFWLFGGFGLYTTGSGLVRTLKAIMAHKRNSQLGGMMPGDEPDPWDKDFDNKMNDYRLNEMNNREEINGNYILKGERNFCPYCGSPARDDFEFCQTCGRQFPQ